MTGDPAHPLVVTVVLNWRRPDETQACVRSLQATEYPTHRVLVIDNSAGTTEIERWLDGLPVEIVRNPENLGFAGGVNVGLRHALDAGADYIWLVNSDATTAPDALGAMVAQAEADARIGLISPVMHAPADPEKVVFCLGRHRPGHVTGDSTTDPVEASVWLREHPEECVLYGAALLVRRALAEQIGGLDDLFFAYSEDVDYCLRCHDAGFRVAVCFGAIVFHHFKDLNAAEIPLYVHYFMNRNQLLLWRKRHRFGLLRKGFVWYLYQRLLKIEREQADPVAVNGLLLGLWDGMRGRGGPYNPSRMAPMWLRRSIGRHPGVILNLLEGRAPWRHRGSAFASR